MIEIFNKIKKMSKINALNLFNNSTKYQLKSAALKEKLDFAFSQQRD